jgi:uncharacterized membrane protein
MLFLTFKSTNVKNLSFLLLALATSITLMMTACSKAGPAGATGATGATGAAGPAGASATDSTVQYSPWITLTATPYIDVSNDTDYVDTLNTPALTNAVLDQDVVLGYIQFFDGNNDTTIAIAGTVLEENYGVGYIELSSLAPAATPTSGFNFTGYNYRYVIIPGDIQVTSTAGSVVTTYTKARLKAMDYPTLSRLLRLPAKGSFLKAGIQAPLKKTAEKSSETP